MAASLGTLCSLKVPARTPVKSCSVRETQASGLSTSFLLSPVNHVSLVADFPNFGLNCPGRISMAVPKKKTSRTKTKQRKAVWYAKGKVAAAKAISLAKSILTRRGNFIYQQNQKDKSEDAEESEA